MLNTNNTWSTHYFVPWSFNFNVCEDLKYHDLTNQTFISKKMLNTEVSHFANSLSHPLSTFSQVTHHRWSHGSPWWGTGWLWLRATGCATVPPGRCLPQDAWGCRCRRSPALVTETRPPTLCGMSRGGCWRLTSCCLCGTPPRCRRLLCSWLRRAWTLLRTEK